MNIFQYIVSHKIHKVLLEESCVPFAKELRTHICHLFPDFPLEFDIVSEDDAYTPETFLISKLAKNYPLFIVSSENAVLCTPFMYLSKTIFVVGEKDVCLKYDKVKYTDGTLYSNPYNSVTFPKGRELSVSEKTNLRDKPQRFLQYLVDILNQLDQNLCIIELGTVSTSLQHPLNMTIAECCDTGHSTYYFTKVKNATVHTVDTNPACKQLLMKAYNSGNLQLEGDLEIHTVSADKFLSSFSNTYNVLYIDLGPLSPEQCLSIVKLGMKNLDPYCSFIAIDNTDIDLGHQVSTVIPYLLENGYYLLSKGRIVIATNIHPSKIHVQM